MKKALFLINGFGFLLITLLLGIALGMCYADSCAKESAMNEELLDIVELTIEKDNNCEITMMDYHHIKQGYVYYWGYYIDDDKSFYCRCNLKHIAPFRYEWVMEDTDK